MLRPLFHIAVVVINSFAIYYDQTFIELPLPVKEMESLPLKSRSLYLTTWCFILQTLYFSIAFLNDIMGTNAQISERPLIRKIKDTLFPIAYNVAMYVTFTFWSLYIINKDWIITEEVEKLYPPILNHVFHTSVSIFMFIEILMPYKTYPPRFIGHVFILTFVIIYTIWYFIVFAKFGVGIYPLFNYLNWPARILFMSVSIAILPFLYNISEVLNDFVASKKNNKDVTKYI